ncbi:hypothetical protein CLU79DRAFT_735925 [Phycomyces nitens]|nr:hypothetical protein CLU79DRAFT_735925 [Phycomyces nitens]
MRQQQPSSSSATATAAAAAAATAAATTTSPSSPSSIHLPGKLVFAKLKGYPWWPARIANEQNVPQKVLAQKAKTKCPLWTVYFFGTKDYGFVGMDNIKPFKQEDVERDLNEKKFKSKDLEDAVRQALGPSEEEPIVPEDSPMPKKTRKKPDPTVAKRKKAKAEKDEGNGPKKRQYRKQAKGDPDEVPGDKKRRKSMTKEAKVDHQEGPKNVSGLGPDPSQQDHHQQDHHHNNNNQQQQHFLNELKTRDLDIDHAESTESQVFRKVYHIRHKLQKLVYCKKPGEIPKEDYNKINLVVKEIEDVQMNYHLLKETKMGKVVKAACSYSYEDEVEYNIKDRCQQLLKTWRTELLASNENNSPESLLASTMESVRSRSHVGLEDRALTFGHSEDGVMQRV